MLNFLLLIALILAVDADERRRKAGKDIPSNYEQEEMDFMTEYYGGMLDDEFYDEDGFVDW